MDKKSLLYTSFDVVPSKKGAAVHIEQFALSIAQAFGDLKLLTVAPPGGAADRAGWTGIQHVEMPAPGDDLIARVMNFRRLLISWLLKARQNDEFFEIVHFRSPFEGLPFVQDGFRDSRLIFEVNGLPSIELKYRYPKVADDEVLLEKLIAQEDLCLEAAQTVVTTCKVTKDYLIGRGVREDKIRVIPNGVQLELFPFREYRGGSKETDFKLLYVGTLSGWQGVDTSIRALALLQEEFPARLTIIGPASAERVGQLRDFAHTLGVADRVNILPAVEQCALISFMHAADVILAPLTANDRNLVQGCCPLKVLEAMASGTPVLASDMPVVSEITDDTCLLVKPGSAGSLKDGIVQIRNSPAMAAELSRRARLRIEHNYTWARAGLSLVDCYNALLCLPA